MEVIKIYFTKNVDCQIIYKLQDHRYFNGTTFIEIEKGFAEQVIKESAPPKTIVLKGNKIIIGGYTVLASEDVKDDMFVFSGTVVYKDKRKDYSAYPNLSIGDHYTQWRIPISDKLKSATPPEEEVEDPYADEVHPDGR